MQIVILIFLFIYTTPAFSKDNFAGFDTMNDISYSEYKEFPQKWELVTIRFRKDTGEMRLTYANEVAMKTLKSGSINYPDGAVFAKMGINTTIDEQFISSVVPKGIRRYQLMVRNKSKYPTTNGWGYALYDPDGKTFPEDPVTTQNSCFACHTIVENRGDVFSQPFSLVSNLKMPNLQLNHMPPPVQFVWKKWQRLPPTIQKLVPKTFQRLRWLSYSKLRENVFQGTLDELKPILESESRSKKTPALFMSKDYKKFVLIIPVKKEECVGLESFKVISTNIDLKHIEENYCTHD